MQSSKKRSSKSKRKGRSLGRLEESEEEKKHSPSEEELWNDELKDIYS